MLIANSAFVQPAGWRHRQHKRPETAPRAVRPCLCRRDRHGGPFGRRWPTPVSVVGTQPTALRRFAHAPTLADAGAFVLGTVGTDRLDALADLPDAAALTALGARPDAAALSDVEARLDAKLGDGYAAAIAADRASGKVLAVDGWQVPETQLLAAAYLAKR